MRERSILDRLIVTVDRGLKMMVQPDLDKPYPRDMPQPVLSPEQTQLSANLMRVNHAGEVAAQGLYHGQALVAEQESVRALLQQAADEEGFHLSWCARRVHELNSHVSLLTPCWYWGSYLIGILVGLRHDAFSLGFVVETELQVEQHLTSHLQRLPVEDDLSRAIISQMQEDEKQHGQHAEQSGGMELPQWVKVIMRGTAKIMTFTAYRL